MGTAELYDVIVVAARAPGRGAGAQLAESIARRYRLAPQAVALGLERGVLEIHRGLAKNDAIAASRQLHELGAVAELRPARDVSGVLNIEPDAEPAQIPESIPIPSPMSRAIPTADLPPAPPPFGVVDPARPPESSRPAAPARVPSSTRPPTEAATIDPNAPAITAAALGHAPAPARFAPPTGGERVELDLAAVGLASAPVGTSALARNRPTTGENKRVTGTEIAEVSELPAATSGRFASESMRAPAPAMPQPQYDSQIPHGLLSSDRVLSVLMAGVVGAVLGFVIAFGWVRGDATDACAKLELELAGSVADPIAVEEGRARPADAIAKELEGKLADLRQTFFLVWAVIAVPIAGIGAIPRPPSG